MSRRKWIWRLSPPGCDEVSILRGSYSGRALHSERVDVKSRQVPDGLDARRDLHSPERTRFVGEASVLSPLGMRGIQFDLSLTCRWGPCFEIIRWSIGTCHMAVAVRPSPPYRDWIRWNSPPLTLRKASNHIDSALDSIRYRRGPNDASSSEIQPNPCCSSCRGRFRLMGAPCPS